MYGGLPSHDERYSCEQELRSCFGCVSTYAVYRPSPRRISGWFKQCWIMGMENAAVLPYCCLYLLESVLQVKTGRAT